MHFAGSPISFMANVHCAAATQNFVALEHHSVDIPWWEDLVKGIEKPIFREGFVNVPDAPGLASSSTIRMRIAHVPRAHGTRHRATP